jgi:hypothetical protein
LTHGDGPHRRIIKPSKSLVTNSRALRAAADLARASNRTADKIGGICPCWSKASTSSSLSTHGHANVETPDDLAVPKKGLCKVGSIVIPEKVLKSAGTGASATADISFDATAFQGHIAPHVTLDCDKN